MNTQHATLVADWKGTSLDALCQYAVNAQISHLWVFPSSGIVANKQYFNAALAEWDLRAAWDIDDKTALIGNKEQNAISIVGWKRPHGGKIVICFPFNGSWVWADEDLTAPCLIDTVVGLEECLGVEAGNSAGSMGMRLLQLCNKDHREWLKAPEQNLRELPFDQAATDVVYDRPLTPAENRMSYLHKYDKNSAYLRSCVEHNFGDSQITFVDGSAYNPLFPGIWRVSVTDQNYNPYAGKLPHPLGPRWRNGEYLATPIVKLLQKMGYEVKIHDGWAYTDGHYHGTLKTWANELWNKRKALKEQLALDPENTALDNVYWSIKQIATTTIGLAGSSKIKEEKSFKYRPDWRCQVVGGTRSLMFYNMIKHLQNGFSPCIVYMDAIYYASNDPNPATAIPGILQHKDSLGGYKHEWTLPLITETKNIIKTYQGRTNTMLAKLNALAEEI